MARNVAALGAVLEGADLTTRMYRILFESIRNHFAPALPSNTFNFLISLVGGCQRGFVVGMDRLLKGHYTDSYQFVRVAIEAACYANKGYRHQHLIPVWLHSTDGDDEHRDFQNRFGSRFGKDPELSGLKEVYDECSRHSHANPFGVVGVLAPDGNNLQATYFDAPNETMLINAFWTTIDGHWFILSLLTPMLIEFTSSHATVEGFLQHFLEVSNISKNGQSKIGNDLRQEVVRSVIH